MFDHRTDRIFRFETLGIKGKGFVPLGKAYPSLLTYFGSDSGGITDDQPRLGSDQFTIEGFQVAMGFDPQSR